MLQQLPLDLQQVIVLHGGLNRTAYDALVRIQKRWRSLRTIARRRAAYMIQDVYRGDADNDSAALLKIRRFLTRRAQLRGE